VREGESEKASENVSETVQDFQIEQGEREGGVKGERAMEGGREKVSENVSEKAAWFPS